MTAWSCRRPATSRRRSPPAASPALARGFAVLSSDSGHSGADPANKPLGLAAGAAFGLDPQARRDYGYAADMTLAPIAKAILAAHYGRKPDFSYMDGCSNGGRHTMVAAERMPETYDGFLAGDPGFDLPRAAIQHAWDAQAFVKADPDIRKSITKDDGALVSRKIIAACDKLDGLEDGLTANLAACQKAFSFDSLVCAAGATADCLPRAKVEALKMSFAGPHNSKGEALYSDWPVDGGVGTGNWRLWKVESPIPPWNNYPIIATMGAASLEYIFTTPPTEVAGTNDALVKALLDFDFDTDAPKIFARTDAYPGIGHGLHDAARRGRPEARGVPRAGPQDDRLSRAGRPGVLDQRHDPLVREARTPISTARRPTVVRLFAVPGMTHCGDGVALDRFDALTALIDWVEKGKAPDRSSPPPIRRTRRSPPPGARTAPVRSARGRDMRATAGGDPESAASFECAAP